MNKGKIIRKGFSLYLKVTGEPLDKPAYFEIQSYATKDKIKEIAQLSDSFDIDLSGNNESKDNSKKRKLSKKEFKNLSKRISQEY